MKTACVDLDGVLAEYEGWTDGAIGNPIVHAIDGLVELKRTGHRVVVFTARSPFDVRAWIEDHQLQDLVDDVTDHKPRTASVFFDDRARHVPSNRPGALLAAVRSWLQEAGERAG